MKNTNIPLYYITLHYIILPNKCNIEVLTKPQRIALKVWHAELTVQ